MLSEGVSLDVARSGAARDAEALLSAFVAGYALMAHADGELASSERRRFLALVRQNPAFDIFSQDDVVEQVSAQEAAYREDPDQAKHDAWDKLEAVAGQRRTAHTLAAACRALIAADSVAHPAEYRMLSAIKSRLGIDGLPPYA